VAAPVTQTHFRIYQDDAGVGLESAYAAEDTNVAAIQSTIALPPVITILRIQSLTTPVQTGSTCTLQYSIDGGAYAQVPTTIGADFISMADSPYFTNGASVDSILTAPGGGTDWTAGSAQDTSSQITGINLSTNWWQENLWSIYFSASAVGHVYTFHQLYSVGSQTWTSVPSITVKNSYFRIHNV
jgi:hypothetical protein